MATHLVRLLALSQMHVAAGPGPDVMTVLTVASCVLGVLLLVVTLMIAAWLYKDCKARGVSPTLWTLLGAIPIVNFVALFVYMFSEGGAGAVCEKHGQPLAPGQDKCLMCVQEEMMAQQQALVEDMRAEQEAALEGSAAAPAEAPAPGSSHDRRATAPIAMAPSTVISLQQLGGPRHGVTTTLTTRNPFGQRIRNTIGRDPNCDLPLADDDNASSQHCTISEDEAGNFYVADLDSLNGTMVIRNGQETKVQSGRHVIEDGDILRIGGSEFRVIITRPPKAASDTQA